MTVALRKAIPLKIGIDIRGRTGNITIHGFGAVVLAGHELVERVQTALKRGHNVIFKLLEVVLNADEVGAVTVLLHQLFVESVPNASLNDVRVICCAGLTATRIETGRVLTKELNVFLGAVTSRLDSLAMFARPRFKFFTLGFDFLVQSLKNRKDARVEVVLCLGVKLRLRVSVGPNVFKQASNAAHGLMEMMTLLERVVERLQDFLVVLALFTLILGDSFDVVLKVAAHMLPSL